MSDSWQEMIYLALSVIFAVVLIVFAVSLWKDVSKVPQALISAMNQTTADIDEMQYTKYANSELTGSDVITALRRFKDDSIEVKVVLVNSNGTASTHYKSEFFVSGSLQNLPTSALYVNPASSFTGEITQYTNDYPAELTFTQQSYVGAVTASVAGAATGLTVESGSVTIESGSLEESVTSDTSSEDVEIVFSDEDDSDSEVTEASLYVTQVQTSIENYANELDTIATTIGNFNIESGESSTLTNLQVQLTSIQNDVSSLSSEVNDSNLLSDSQKTTIVSSLAELQNVISSSVKSLTSLQNELTVYQDTNSTWYVGYPIQTDVKVTLSEGVLTFSGSGGTQVMESLPEWLNRAEDIEQVVFKSGVAPTSVDYWFSGCENLTTVKNFPDSITSANGTFQECVNLTGTIELPDGVESATAFRTCSSTPKSLILIVNAGSTTEETLREYLDRVGTAKTGISLEVD